MMGLKLVDHRLASLVSISLVAARLTIARVWIASKPPSVNEWWLLVKETYAMEKALAQARGICSLQKLDAVWGLLF